MHTYLLGSMFSGYFISGIIDLCFPSSRRGSGRRELCAPAVDMGEGCGMSGVRGCVVFVCGCGRGERGCGACMCV